ncbi:4-oxalocrotonate tautomerase family protein [Zoogloea sp.]|uniref:tautomerase family protein n=1 Tax=Zoogloea sp. TaxID=49181 RepID=UPI0035B16AA5
MPFARLTLLVPQPDVQVAALSQSIAGLVAGLLHKRFELTSVLVETPNGNAWTIGGRPQKVAAHLDVTVTAGTNSPQEKADFIQRAMVLLRKALPDLHVATYVVVTETPAHNWGYDGQTQAQRALAQSNASAHREAASAASA